MALLVTLSSPATAVGERPYWPAYEDRQVPEGCLRVRFEHHRRGVHEPLGRSLCYDKVPSFAGLVVMREPTKVAITGFRNGLLGGIGSSSVITITALEGFDRKPYGCEARLAEVDCL